MRTFRPIPAVRILGVTAIVAWSCGTARAQEHPVFDAKGAQSGHEYSGQLPAENIDTLNGNLQLTFTDLHLPGNAGLDLAIQRSFNSKGLGSWTFGLAGMPMKVLNAEAQPPWWPAELIRDPVIVAADGGKHETTPQDALTDTRMFGTREFWRYDREANEVLLPNGVVAEFGILDARDSDPIVNPAGRNVRYLTAVRDPFGNRITLAYTQLDDTYLVNNIHQDLGGGQIRDITFDYEDDVQHHVRSMAWNGRTWTYLYTSGSIGQLLMSEVIPPVGARWRFGYTNDELTSMTTPHGGVIGYEYQSHIFSYPEIWGRRGDRSSPGTKQSRVVSVRTTGGRGIAPGRWEYTYSEALATDKKTTIVGPDSVVTSHYAFTAQDWEIDWREIADLSGNVLEREERDYTFIQYDRWSTYPISSAPLVSFRRLIWRLPPAGSGSATTRTWAVENKYHASDFGQPWQVVEYGDFTRTTTRSFDYGIGVYRSPPVSTETVDEGGRTSGATFGYNGTTGFLEYETHDTLAMNYRPDEFGNRRLVQDAIHPPSTTSYEWGVPKFSRSAGGITVDRAINSDGTVASETRRGFTTTFQYDDVSRVKRVVPPAGNQIVTDYDNIGGASITVTRGRSSVVTDMDGFGRPTGTRNSLGVRTETNYDAAGRRSYESLPFTGARVGDIVAYDALGRVRSRRHNDNATVRMDYELGPAGYDVRVTDENGRVSVQHWIATGDPGRGRLSSLVDAKNAQWRYEYHVTGALAKVIAPNTPDNPASDIAPRTWTYNAQNLLASETHPESGTTSYTQYDGVGNLLTKVDQAGTSFGYEYDNDNRLKTVTASGPNGSQITRITYEDNSDKRAKIEIVGGASVTFGYDAAGRLSDRNEAVHGRALNTHYAYEGDDLDTITYPSGRAVEYGYNDEGQATDVRDVTIPQGITYASNAQYHASGGLGSFTAGNGLVQTQEYNPDRYWPTHVGVGSLLSVDYGNYDGVGNARLVSSRRGSAPSRIETFEYDEVDRLLSMTSQGPGNYGATQFKYDVHGNRLSNVYGTYTYYSGTLRLQTQGPDTFNYDGNGNLRTATRAGASAQYDYRPDNMMSRAVVNGSTSTYEYDGDQQRVVRTLGVGTSAASTTLYSYGPAAQLLGEYLETSGGFAPVRDYIYLGSRLVASVDTPTVTVGLSATAASVSEAAGSIQVSVVLRLVDDRPLDHEVTVAYATADGTASAGQDYVARSGSVTFQVGSLNGASRPIVVTLTDDASDEPDETFRVNLSNPVGAAISFGSEVVTLRDNDPNLTFAIDIPSPGQRVLGRVSVGGWAIDRESASGTGIDAVTVYAKGSDGVEKLLGPAVYGLDRGDIAQLYGLQFKPSGYALTVWPLPPGDYQVYLKVHFTSDGSTRQSSSRTFTSVARTDLERGGDFDGDLRSDMVVYNVAASEWSWLTSGSGYATKVTKNWGGSGYTPAPGDYDGDGAADLAAYQESTGTWNVLLSGANFTTALPPQYAGGPGWIPVPGDYDGDGKNDIAVYNTTTGVWYGLKSSTNYTTSFNVTYGGTGWTPVPADYDGDGKTDVGTYQTATGHWSVPLSSMNWQGSIAGDAGGPGWIPVAADYDGDRKAEFAVYNAKTAVWYGLKSSTSYTTSFNINWGGIGYAPATGDYDGDGKADIATYKAATGTFNILLSGQNFTTAASGTIGGNGYVPLPSPVLEQRLDAGIMIRGLPAGTAATVCAGFTVTGWALDATAAGGTGVEPTDVKVNARPVAGGAVILLGTATYGTAAPSTVVTTYGSRAELSGFSRLVAPLPRGSYDVYLSVRMTAAGVIRESPPVRLTSAGGADFRCAGGDFDGDVKTDYTVYDPTTGVWTSLLSNSNYSVSSRTWGGTGYVAVPGDYDGDGKADLGLYVPSTGAWNILLSGSNFTTALTPQAGGSGWIPVPGDYDGDGKTDVAVYNTTTGVWNWLKSGANNTLFSISYGGTGWTAVPADFDGDGKTDIGVYQASTGTWSVPLSSTNFTTSLTQYPGGPSWVPVAADFDGDGKADFMVYKAATGTWYGLKSSTNYTTSINIGWGASDYIPIKGDFDGDGKADIAVYRTTTGMWNVLLSGANYTTATSQTMAAGLVPVPKYP